MEKIAKTFNLSKTEKIALKIVLFLGAIILSVLAITAMKTVRKKRKVKNEVKNKLKYFKPTIKESFWCKTVTWEQREKPLSDTEIDHLCENNLTRNR